MCFVAAHKETGGRSSNDLAGAGLDHSEASNEKILKLNVGKWCYRVHFHRISIHVFLP